MISCLTVCDKVFCIIGVVFFKEVFILIIHTHTTSCGSTREFNFWLLRHTNLTHLRRNNDIHLYMSWRLALHGAQGRRPQPLQGRSRLESLALALECPGRTLLEPHPHPSSHSGDSADASAPDRPAPQSRLPYPLAEPKDRVRTGVGASQQPLLGFWGDLYLDSRVCV